MDEHTFEQKRKRHRPFVGVKNSMGLPLIKIEYHCSLKKKKIEYHCWYTILRLLMSKSAISYSIYWELGFDKVKTS